MKYILIEDIHHSVSDDTESFIVASKGTIVSLDRIEEINAVIIDQERVYIRRDQLKELKDV